MFWVNCVFVLTLLAVVFARVPQREWLSSSVVVFGLGLIALAAQLYIEDLLQGEPIGVVARLCLLWFFLLCGYSARRMWLDLKEYRARRAHVVA